MGPRPDDVTAWWTVVWPIASFALGAVIIIHEVFYRRQAQLEVLGVGSVACGWALDRLLRWVGDQSAKKTPP